jgi:hypothetical protein
VKDLLKENLMRIEKSVIKENPPSRKPEQGLVLKGKERKKIDPCCEEDL